MGGKSYLKSIQFFIYIKGLLIECLIENFVSDSYQTVDHELI